MKYLALLLLCGCSFADSISLPVGGYISRWPWSLTISTVPMDTEYNANAETYTLQLTANDSYLFYRLGSFALTGTLDSWTLGANGLFQGSFSNMEQFDYYLGTWAVRGSTFVSGTIAQQIYLTPGCYNWDDCGSMGIGNITTVNQGELATVPEPGTGVLWLTSLACLGGYAMYRKVAA